MSLRSQRIARDCSISKILDADAKSKDNQDLGEVKDTLINPQTGNVDFVVLGQGGVLGIGEDRVPVPRRAVNVQSDGTLVVNQNKERPQSTPTTKKDYSNLDQPGYTMTIYEFYPVPVPAATGGSQSPGGQQGGSKNNSNSSTDSWNNSNSSQQ